MWENLLEKTTLTISFTYSHDKCEQNKYNINRHHEITRNIYDGKNKTKFIARIINDNMKGMTPDTSAGTFSWFKTSQLVPIGFVYM